MQARELPGQRLERVLLIAVVDIQPALALHGDLEGDVPHLGWTDLLEGIQGAGDVHHHVRAKAAADRAAEIRRCEIDIILLPSFDARRIAAERRLRVLSSGPHFVWRKTRLGVKSFGRIFGRELILAFLIPLQLLLIAVCNVVGFLLLWWLLFGF